MKKSIVLILITVSAALIAMARGPKIAFEPEDVWIGTLPHDTLITFKVAVRNVGDQPLIITRVNKSCNCTEVVFPSEIAPHKDDTATFTVKTSKIAPGRFTKYVTFVSNDPDYTNRYYYSGEILEVNE